MKGPADTNKKGKWKMNSDAFCSDRLLILCIQSWKESKKIFVFCLIFLPQNYLMYLYEMHAPVNVVQLKTTSQEISKASILIFEMYLK